MIYYYIIFDYFLDGRVRLKSRGGFRKIMVVSLIGFNGGRNRS